MTQLRAKVVVQVIYGNKNRKSLGFEVFEDTTLGEVSNKMLDMVDAVEDELFLEQKLKEMEKCL